MGGSAAQILKYNSVHLPAHLHASARKQTQSPRPIGSGSENFGCLIDIIQGIQSSMDQSEPRGAKRIPPILLSLRSTLFELKPKNLVYFLIYESNVVYVGSTTCLNQRIKSHRRDLNKMFDRVLYLEFKSRDQMIEKESQFIRKFKPIYNKAGKTEGAWWGKE